MNVDESCQSMKFCSIKPLPLALLKTALQLRKKAVGNLCVTNLTH